MGHFLVAHLRQALKCLVHLAALELPSRLDELAMITLERLSGLLRTVLLQITFRLSPASLSPGHGIMMIPVVRICVLRCSSSHPVFAGRVIRSKASPTCNARLSPSKMRARPNTVH